MPFCHLKLIAKKILHGYPKNIKTIGDHLRKKRLDLELSQKEVAQIIGVSEATIWNWENNRKSPKVSFLPKIFEFLGYSLYEPKISFPEKLAFLRKSLGLSQEKLAKLVGLDESTIRKLEKGKSKPAKKTLEKLEKFFNFPLVFSKILK